MAIPSHFGRAELQVWSDMIWTPGCVRPLGCLLSIMTGLLRVGGPRQCLVLGEVTLLHSFDDMKHNKLVHAQGGQPHGIMKGGTSSNRASYSGTGIVSWPFIEELAGSFGHQNVEQDLGTISSQRAQQTIRKVISSLASAPPSILIQRTTSPALPVVAASRFCLEIRG